MNVRPQHYDFTDMQECLYQIQQKPSPNLLRELERELNLFFKEANCKEVIYTNNNDKMFFGMCVMPVMQPKDVLTVLQSSEPYVVNSYYIELDSKLFSRKLGLASDELLAVLLHEVGHMVNDSAPIEKVRQNLDTYLIKNNETIPLTDSIHYIEILLYAIKDSLRKVTSLFEHDDSEIHADEFVMMCGYGPSLKSALKKIVANSYNLNKDVDNKLMVLCWILRLYKDVQHKRIPAIRTLNRGKALTGSKLEKKEMDNVIRRLNRIDDDALLSESVATAISDAFGTTVKRFKAEGIKGIQDDYYELVLQSNNLETDSDAILLIHQVNAKMSILSDYMLTEKIDPGTRKRLTMVYDQYNKLRADIASHSTFMNRQHLVVQYPVGYGN